MIEVEPRFIAEAPTAISLESNTPARVSRYRTHTADTDLTPVFKQQRGQLSDGRIAVYLVQSTTDSSVWYAVDVYENNTSLQADAVPQTLNGVARLEQSDDIQNGIMANKGNFHWHQPLNKTAD